MGTTSDKLNKLIDTKSNIRDSIISKGVDVPVELPFGEYPNKIEEIGYDEDVMFVRSHVWDYINLLEFFPTSPTLYTYAFQGMFFISTNDASYPGIYKLDKDAKTLVHIYSEVIDRNSWIEFDDELYVSASSTNGNGILKLNSDRNSFSKIYSSGHSFSNHFKTSQNELFVSSSSASVSGILKLNNDRNGFTLVHSLHYDWKHWVETDNGAVIVSSGSTGTNGGILILNENRNSFTRQSQSGSYIYSNWRAFGHNAICSSPSGQNSVFIYNDESKSFTSGINQYSINVWYEFKDILVGTGNFAYLYIFHRDSTPPTTISTGGYSNYNRGIIFEDKLYLGSTLSSTGGIIRLNDNLDSVESLVGGNAWANFKEFSGELYVSSSSNIPVYKLNEDRTSFVPASSISLNNYLNWWENSENELFLTANSSPVYKLNESHSDFIRVSDVNTYYTGPNNIIDGRFLISRNDSINITSVFDLNISSFTNKYFCGTVVGDWILNMTQFTKFSSEYPLEIFVPTIKLANSTPSIIGDLIGNVYIISNQAMHFNVKPL